MSRNARLAPWRVARFALRRAWMAAPVILGCALLPPSLDASLAGAIPARTGGFGEMTCQQCHWDNPLNDPSGQIRLEGVPAAYAPGERYLITLTLSRAGLRRAGFQLSAREAGIDMNSGSDAGVLRATDELAATIQDDRKRVTYLQHTEAGAASKTAGTARWTFEWTAPEGGSVVFHVAGNASNDDASPLGDFIFTSEAQTAPRPD